MFNLIKIINIHSTPLNIEYSKFELISIYSTIGIFLSSFCLFGSDSSDGKDRW